MNETILQQIESKWNHSERKAARFIQHWDASRKEATWQESFENRTGKIKIVDSNKREPAAAIIKYSRNQ